MKITNHKEMILNREICEYCNVENKYVINDNKCFSCLEKIAGCIENIHRELAFKKIFEE